MRSCGRVATGVESTLANVTAYKGGMARTQVSADKWFVVAEEFNLAFLLLTDNATFKLAVFQAGFALGAFASECYLKSLLALEEAKPDFVHDLKFLYDKVSPDSRKAIKRWWDRASLPLLLLHNEGKDSKFCRPRSLGEALEASKDAFEDMRYGKPGEKHGYALYTFPLCVRTRILQLQPTWVPKSPAPNSAINPHTQLIESKKERFDFITSEWPKFDSEPKPLLTSIHIRHGTDGKDGSAA